MTEDEAQTVTSETLREHQATTRHLACLRAKARRMSDSFRKIADGLVMESYGNVDEFLVELPLTVDIKSTLEQIKAAKTKIDTLEGEMDAQGFGDYIPSRNKRVLPAPDDD